MTSKSSHSNARRSTRACQDAIGDEALELSPLAWQTRYPDEAAGANAPELSSAMQVAQRVLDEVIVRLAPEVAP